MTADKYISALRYSWLTPFYDFIVGLTTRETTFKKALLSQAAIKPGYRVLDLGCGTGTLAILAKQSQPDAEIVGIDGDAKALRLAEDKASRSSVDIQFEQGDVTALPYPRESFDRILSSLLFHHLSSKAKGRALQESFRVLEPGGELHLADWGRPHGIMMRALFLGVQLLDGFATTSDDVQGRLPEMCVLAGFKSVVETGSYRTIFGTIRLHVCRKQ